MSRRSHKVSGWTPFTRAIDIVQRIQAGQRLSIVRLQETYEVTRRQAYRIRNDIMATLPVVEEQTETGTYLRLVK